MRRLAALAGVVLAGGACGAVPAARLARTGRPEAVPAAAGARARGPAYAVGEAVIRLVDRSRTVVYPGRRPEARPLTTVIRYPTGGRPSPADVRSARPLTAAGPFPLVVFGHGFAVTPATYHRLLHAWAQAGYVVAAPVFPLENAHAPGGPNESDLVNQPRDMRFVISTLLRSRGPFAGLIDPRAVAVAGQSDGGETALAVAYDRRFEDARVRAAVILSGARLPGGALRPASSGLALLATQGTADTINQPSNTYAFVDAIGRPKFLLRLIGAGHLPPYAGQQPQEGVVERVTTAFLDGYLKHRTRAVRRMRRAGDIAGVGALTALP
jgi:dienelactone hydrolase